MSRLRQLAVALTVAALASCAAVPVRDEGALSGRLAVQVAAHAGEAARGFSVGFELRGNADEGALTLHNPLGLQFAAAHWRPGRAVLLSADGEQVFADLDALALRALGEPVPLQALSDWLRGRAWAGAPAQALPKGFDQLGWTVDLSRQADGLVSALRPAPPAIMVRARLEAPP